MKSFFHVSMTFQIVKLTGIFGFFESFKMPEVFEFPKIPIGREIMVLTIVFNGQKTETEFFENNKIKRITK